LAQKIIIDADPGIGDALAILVALADSSLDVLGLTAVAGMVSGIQATRNLHYLIGIADPLRHPRVGQSDVAVCSADQTPLGLPHPQALNGRFGLGEVDPLVPDLHNRRESAKLIVDLVREHPNEVRIVSFGPLTNVAMALDLDPELPFLLISISRANPEEILTSKTFPDRKFQFLTKIN
jgi:inosine-uridine nucleoside N-ribohydrolase